MLRPSSFGKPARPSRNALETERILAGEPFHEWGQNENGVFRGGSGSREEMRARQRSGERGLAVPFEITQGD